jgi:hypothetical protein
MPPNATDVSILNSPLLHADLGKRLSGKDPIHNCAMNVGESEITALESISEAFVVDP